MLWRLRESPNKEEGGLKYQKGAEVQQICERHIFIAFCANANAALANQNQREE